MKLPLGLTPEKIAAAVVIALIGAFAVAWVQKTNTPFGKLLRGER